jgi:hypothetical protein
MPIQDPSPLEQPKNLRRFYLLSQALYVAIPVLEAVPIERREVSNIADMKELLDKQFPVYKAVAEINDQFQQQRDAEISSAQQETTHD